MLRIFKFGESSESENKSTNKFVIFNNHDDIFDPIGVVNGKGS